MYTRTKKCLLRVYIMWKCKIIREEYSFVSGRKSCCLGGKGTWLGRTMGGLFYIFWKIQGEDSKISIEWVSLFINVNEAMDWGLG